MRLIVFIALLATGCTMHQLYQATSGSKSDGVIRLSYEAPSLRQVVVDESQGLALAIDRCKAWGYNSAEEFGGIIRACQTSGRICSSWLITKEYQCLDKPTQ